MEKVFLGVLAGSVSEDVMRAVRGLLDFIHYARFETHTTTSLEALKVAWRQFHIYKYAFITYYNAKQAMPANYANFSGIPKLHRMDHYIQSIRLLGTADRYNTEGPERLHIDFAKLGYRASNHRNYFGQMTTWLDHQEAAICFDAYLHWLQLPGLREKELKDAEDKEEGIARAETTSVQFKVAKKPPYPLLFAGAIAKSYGARDFSWHLEAFLTERAHSATQLVPQSTIAEIKKISTKTGVPVYKQLKLRLPAMAQVSTADSLEWDTIQAVPRASESLRGTEINAMPAVFSTVLAHRWSSQTTGLSGCSPLHDLSIGQVRVIFRAPDVFRDLVPELLVFVQWYTPLNMYDEVSAHL
ncbi:uncharacterized protein PHACADRAFT_203252 [Phanerochaete carnosa HHB-10118-sp]|uniref:Uncharacterized protein n=1 Tax=Phanerochaete carnosa (strain HHB-10118-sp) TaxID=650164 RepID=K5UF74_PHACS|nr:uncharacterized protein PHACADRAFT_203252 [Phanerochaete carnosa HHB-10118-sp]EKM48101.1 hypothetical protein PHACADRAFT_203252 [Phanerochaete carnosa HHB-10118-sp]